MQSKSFVYKRYRLIEAYILCRAGRFELAGLGQGQGDRVTVIVGGKDWVGCGSELKKVHLHGSTSYIHARLYEGYDV